MADVVTIDQLITGANRSAGDVTAWASNITASGQGQPLERELSLTGQSLTNLQQQMNNSRRAFGQLATIVNNISGLTIADIIAAGFRYVTASNIVLAADTMLTATAPVNAGDQLFVYVKQNGTGGWNITWDTNLLGATSQLGVTLANTRYLFGFVGINTGSLVWVNTSQLLAF